MTPRDESTAGSGADDAPLWAELEGGTEGPRGRGRDQEVISQTDRQESVRAAADRGIAARELFDHLLGELAEDSRLMVDRTDEDDVRVLTIRSSAPAQREVTIQFDLEAGSIAFDRNDGTGRAALDVDAVDPQPARIALRDAISWARDEGCARG
jgi:hypothetical protein